MKNERGLRGKVVKDMENVPFEKLDALINEKHNLMLSAAQGDQSAKNRMAVIQETLLPITNHLTEYLTSI